MFRICVRVVQIYDHRTTAVRSTATVVLLLCYSYCGTTVLPLPPFSVQPTTEIYQSNILFQQTETTAHKLTTVHTSTHYSSKTQTKSLTVQVFLQNLFPHV
eukprot:Lankesteria_metandrocarpae@DN3679_c0_g1_i1.p1